MLSNGFLVCRVCDSKKQLLEFPVDSRTHRYSPRCTKCRYAEKGRPYYERTKNSINKKYDNYQAAARSRGIDFNLTAQEFALFWNRPCTYCDNSINTVGIDRVDNTKGYVASNCVPCCELCNKMKREQTKAEFIAQCRKIVQRFDAESQEDKISGARVIPGPGF